MHRGMTLALVAAMTAPVASAKQRELPLLAPSTPWNIDYDLEACRLQRAFGDGDDRITLRLVRYGPGRGFEILASGKRLGATERELLSYGFAPGGEETKVDHPLFGKGDDGVTTWQFSAKLLPDDKDDDGERDTGAFKDREAELNRRYEERLAEIRTIRFIDGVVKPVALNLGDMVRPMAAMEQCVDDLTASWGLDPVVQNELQCPPRPKSNPGRWIKVGDYPETLLRKGISGKIPFRLMVDAGGLVTSCKIQALYSDSAFEKAVCPVLGKRASFDPALDAKGQPVASVWTTSVVFVTS